MEAQLIYLFHSLTQVALGELCYTEWHTQLGQEVTVRPG